jgi:hypothetical protein
MITLAVAKVNISKEMSLADFDLHVLMTCGIKVMEDISPADIPSSSIAFIAYFLKVQSHRMS